jgi:hypothetical protein
MMARISSSCTAGDGERDPQADVSLLGPAGREVRRVMKVSTPADSVTRAADQRHHDNIPAIQIMAADTAAADHAAVLATFTT